MRSQMRLLGALLIVTLTLPGCAAVTALGEASQPLEVYELAAPEVRRVGVRRDVELVVEEPAASGSLATERIMIRPAPLQAQYFPGVRWADIAPVMVQTLIVRSLTGTGAFRSVGRLPVGIAPDFTLLSELTDFEAEATADGARTVVRVRLVFRLVRESDARVVATRTFTATETAGAPDVDAVVRTFDRATARLLDAAIGWVIAETPASVVG